MSDTSDTGAADHMDHTVDNTVATTGHTGHTVYRIIEHKYSPMQENTLDRSVGGKSQHPQWRDQATAAGISETYRGTVKPVVIGQCKDCTFWKRTYTGGIEQVFGTCQTELFDRPVLMWARNWDDSGTIETAEEFGCIMWRQKPEGTTILP